MLSRRSFLAALAAGIAVRPALAATSTTCNLTCAQPEGPCRVASPPVRSDITEGRRGLATLISLQIVEADTCRPLEGESVEIWHADANGLYSGPVGPDCVTPGGGTFLRGVQQTDASGWVNFNTIFPGWYPGRTTHIHVAVRDAVTTQIYFDDALVDLVYSQFEPYSARGPRDTTNATDNFARLQPPRFNAKLVLDKALVATVVVAIRKGSTCLG